MTPRTGGLSRDPKVLITGLWMVPSCGGMPKTIEAFRRALDAGVVSFTDSAQLAGEGSAVQGAIHVRTRRDPLGRFYSWAPAHRRVQADERAMRCDLISCHTLFRYHVHWVRSWVKRRNLPYWVVPHGCLDPYVFSYRGWQKSMWMRLVGRRHLREAKAVIFSTRREKEKASCFLSRDNGRVVYWPVTNLAPSPEARHAARAAWRRELGATEKDRLLVYLGRLHSMKRPAETIEAFLKANPTQSHLVLAGPNGDLTNGTLQVLAGGDRRVHVVGPVWGTRKDTLLAAADGFVSLSIRENFGHSAAEAMKVGLPLILSPGNDLTGELEEVDCGWFLLDEKQTTATDAFQAFDRAEQSELDCKGGAGRAWADRELAFERFANVLKQLAFESIRR